MRNQSKNEQGLNKIRMILKQPVLQNKREEEAKTGKPKPPKPDPSATTIPVNSVSWNTCERFQN